MAWAARSWLTGLLVIVTSFTWFAGFADDFHERLAIVYPPLLAAALLPLAWTIRSRALYTLTFLGLICSLPTLAFAGLSNARYVLIAFAAGGFVAWAAGEFHRGTGIRKEFGNPAANLGLATLAIAAYVWSFHWVWQAFRYFPQDRRLYWLILAGVAIAIGAATLAKAWRRMDDSQKRSAAGIVAASLLLCLSPPLIRFGEAWPAIVVNAAAIVIAAALIGKGILEERRLVFWAGSLFVATLIISRFFEYESSLLLKSAAFIACGVATIFAGVAYEKFLHRREAVAQ
jgi:hypothetical protein